MIRSVHLATPAERKIGIQYDGSVLYAPVKQRMGGWQGRENNLEILQHIRFDCKCEDLYIRFPRTSRTV